MFLSKDPLMAEAAPYTVKRNPITARMYRSLWDRKHRVLDPKFLFVATTGRSGTGFIQKVFSTVEGCSAQHEAWPIMHDHVLRSWNNGEERLARRTYWVQKSVNIRRMTGENDLYVESNHLFIKSFAPYVIEDLGPRLRILHLRRDAVSVARSMVELGAVPGTPHGNDWYLDYRAPRNLVKLEEQLAPGGELDDDFYRCLWYWYEVEARIRELKARTPGLPWFVLSWEGRIPMEGVVELISALGKEPDQSALQLLEGTRANQQSSLKSLRAQDPARLSEMHDRLKRVLREEGFAPIL